MGVFCRRLVDSDGEAEERGAGTFWESAWNSMNTIRFDALNRRARVERRGYTAAMTPTAISDKLFSVCGALVLPCWLLLVVAPRWRVTQQLVTFAIPVLIAAIYGWLLATAHPPTTAGFGSIAQVRSLFSVDRALVAGWIHYLAFDLFIGGWQVRDAKRCGMHHLIVVPCLLLTFLFGPLGLAAYLLLRAGIRRRFGILRDECEALP
jgi:hypothetical protein